MHPSTHLGPTPSDRPAPDVGVVERGVAACSGCGALVGVVAAAPMLGGSVGSLLVLAIVVLVGGGVGLAIGLPVVAFTAWMTRLTRAWRAAGTLAAALLAGALLRWVVPEVTHGSAVVLWSIVIGSSAAAAWVALPWVLGTPTGSRGE